jgi:recombination protein RecT
VTAQTVSQAVEKRDSGPVAIMWTRKRHFDAVLPGSVDVEAFLGTAAGALYASDVPGKKLTLMGCAQANPDSLIVSLMECAALGHMPGTDEYYLTPRMDHGRPKVLGIEGYRGVIERMYRSGAVAKVVVREVCERDYFDYREGEMDIPVHRFAQGTTGAAFFSSAQSRGQMVGGYSYAQLTNGSFSRVVILTRDDIFAARDSGGYKPDDSFSPWNRLDGGAEHPEFTGRSMWWKTLAKRLEPWVPTSREYRREQLRASAAAAEQARPRAGLGSLPDAPALPSGHSDIVEAEIVEHPAVAAQAGQAPAETSASATEQGTPDGSPASPGPAASGIATGRLEQLLQEVPLGTAADRAEFIAWVTGHPADEELTPADVKKLTARLDGALKAVKGNGEQAASALWEQHKQATGAK